jgi:hypothetical protein
MENTDTFKELALVLRPDEQDTSGAGLGGDTGGSSGGQGGDGK